MSQFFFLLSNASFFIPALYLLLPFNYKTNYSLNMVFIHAILCVSTMIGSLMYHVCDVYTSDCVLLWNTMFAMDHVVSTMVPINIFLYNLPTSFLFIRDTIITYTLLSLSYLACAYQTDYTYIDLFYTYGFILSIIILSIRLMIRFQLPNSTLFMWPLRQPGRILIWFPTEGNFWIGIPCILCWIGAFICFNWFNSDMTIYVYIHPLWHFLASMGMTLSFMFFDSLS